MKVYLDDTIDSIFSEHIKLELEFHHIFCKEVELPISPLAQELFLTALLKIRKRI